MPNYVKSIAELENAMLDTPIPAAWIAYQECMRKYGAEFKEDLPLEVLPDFYLAAVYQVGRFYTFE